MACTIQTKARWITTNTDQTLPIERDFVPGSGALVEAVRVVVDIEPILVGKPEPLLYELAPASLVSDAKHTFGIGDQGRRCASSRDRRPTRTDWRARTDEPCVNWFETATTLCRS